MTSIKQVAHLDFEKMEKIIKKAEEVCKAISKSLEEADYNNFRIDFAISTLDGKLYKIMFFDSEGDTTPYGNKYLVEVMDFGNYALTFFGEQSREDFALNSKAHKSIAELCEVVNEYLKESEEDNGENK